MVIEAWITQNAKLLRQVALHVAKNVKMLATASGFACQVLQFSYKTVFRTYFACIVILSSTTFCSALGNKLKQKSVCSYELA